MSEPFYGSLWFRVHRLPAKRLHASVDQKTQTCDQTRKCLTLGAGIILVYIREMRHTNFQHTYVGIAVERNCSTLKHRRPFLGLGMAIVRLFSRSVNFHF